MDGDDDRHNPTVRAAHDVATMLDRGNIDVASQMLRNDLYQMQREPGRQHEFLHMVDEMHQRGSGADLQIQRGPDGREYWNIVPAGDQNYPIGDYRPQQPYQPYGAQYSGQEIPRYPQQQFRDQPRDPGDEFVNALAVGLGVAVGSAIFGRGNLGGRRDYYEHREREHRDYYEHRQQEYRPYYENHRRR